MKLTREEIDQLPYFLNHKSARYFFKQRFGSYFKMTGSEIVEGKKVYMYHLVEDKEAYLKCHSSMRQKGFAPTEDIDSYQPLEITEDGKVKVLF